MGIGPLLTRLAGLCLIAGLLLAGILFPVVGGVGLASNQAGDAVNSVSANLIAGDVPLVTTVTDKDGKPIAYLFDQNRFNTPPDEIADTMKAAIIAIEDRRFFEHNGVDWRGTTRALLTNLASGGSALEGQGASTLTMQYVKNYMLYVVAQSDAERHAAVETTPARKVRELRVALELENQISKEDLLARYLNMVFFGNNAYGVASAAKTYFDTTPDKLSISQAALLAGIVKSTSVYDPVDNPERAMARRNLVIDAMVEVGSITTAQGAAAKEEPLGIQEPLTGVANGCVGAGPADGFYCQYTVDYLKRAGFTEEDLRRGGYTIRTNLDRNASDVAKRAASAQVPTDTEGIANAMAVVEPGRSSHKVRALAANRDFGLDAEAGQTSYPLPSTVQGFGAGSIYKIFTAAAALEKGFGINTEIPVPSTYSSRVFFNEGAPYTVRNAGTYGGPMTLQKALATSPNTAFVALLDRIGSVDPVVDMAYRLGMRDSLETLDPRGTPLREAIKEGRRGSYTLGPEPTSPLDLANVAATLMSGGVWCPPTPIDQMLDRNGDPVRVPEQPCEQAVPEGLANTLAVGLSEDHLPDGTAHRAAQQAEWERPMIGKTGTTQSNRSAGFVGATPQYAASVLVWPDGSQPRPICDGDPPRLCGSGNIFGGRIPARTWFDAMTTLHEDLPVLELPTADPEYVEGGGSQIPDVVGEGEHRARLMLERAGYEVNVTRTNAGRPAGEVVSQSPSDFALTGETVTLSVSNGIRPRPTTTTRPEPEPTEETEQPPSPETAPPETEEPIARPSPPTFERPTIEPTPPVEPTPTPNDESE